MRNTDRNPPDSISMTLSEAVRGLGFSERLGFTLGAVTGSSIAVLHRFGAIFTDLHLLGVLKLLQFVAYAWLLVVFVVIMYARRRGVIRSDLDLASTIAAIRQDRRTLLGFFVLWGLAFVLLGMATVLLVGLALLIKF